LNQNSVEPLNSDRQTLEKKGSPVDAASRRPSSVTKTRISLPSLVVGNIGVLFSPQEEFLDLLRDMSWKTYLIWFLCVKIFVDQRFQLIQFVHNLNRESKG